MAIIAVLGVFVFFCYFLFCTTPGSYWVAEKFLMRLTGSQSVHVGRRSGNLFQQLSLFDVEIRNFKGLPSGSVVRIQKMDAYFTSVDLKGLNIEIHNGRLLSSSAGPLVFDGIYQDARLDFNLFSKDMDLSEFCSYVGQRMRWGNVRGTVHDFDASIKGPWKSLELVGAFRIENMVVKNFSVSDCLCSFLLTLRGLQNNPQMDGEVFVKRGTIAIVQVSVMLEPGKIQFRGDPQDPSFDLKGDCVVENIPIHLTFKGDLHKPELRLTSEPPMPQERLLLMLVTGRSWSANETALHQEEPSPDLAKIGLTEDILGPLQFSYRVQQRPTAQGTENQATTQKLGMDYKLTDHISIGGEKELKPQNALSNQTQSSQPNDSVYLKYKNRF